MTHFANLSRLVQLQRVLFLLFFNLLCVFDLFFSFFLFSQRWQSTLFQMDTTGRQNLFVPRVPSQPASQPATSSQRHQSPLYKTVRGNTRNTIPTLCLLQQHSIDQRAEPGRFPKTLGQLNKRCTQRLLFRLFACN